MSSAANAGGTAHRPSSRPAAAARRKLHLEPFVWLGFSGGGVIAAILLPILIVLFGLALPLGWVRPDFAGLEALLSHPLTGLVLLVALVMMLIHAGHRFRYTLYDGLQVKQRTLVAVICYGAAMLGIVASVVVLIMLVF
ncbi:fumarate reductase subunit FrdD [Microlunatus soli]|uniref:Succinate dehydrogenase subunit D n=1 Tax=Microlunatus soli TaxID=630515 RepID=A0A1H1NHC4_9ACTN|nr:fumarate reductase subunit FrdD [Microlunatus soli]SDR97719.1 succinate dehydrogenase subunit D [Microlunatus soli]